MYRTVIAAINTPEGTCLMSQTELRQRQLAEALTSLELPANMQLRCWKEADFPAIQRLSTQQGWSTPQTRPDEALTSWQHSWPTLVATEKERIIGFVRGLSDGEVTT